MLVASFSGIRGVWGSDLTHPVVSRYGWAYRQELPKRPTVVIGRDTRPSGEELRLSLIEGLGCRIIDVGVLPTPAIEEAVRHFKADAGVIITASHNPPEHNGLKLLGPDGGILPVAAMEKVIARYEKVADLDEESFLKKLFADERLDAVEKRHREAKERYVTFLASFFSDEEIAAMRKASGMVIDPNGGAGTLWSELASAWGLKTRTINDTPGTYTHPIEPTADHLPTPKEGEILFGFDCDADRVEIMTADGPIDGNRILGLLVSRHLSRLDDASTETVVVNDATSWLVKRLVEGAGARYQESPVGEAHVVAAMDKASSGIGGEGSNGGVIISPSRCRDGILTTLALLSMLGSTSLGELITTLPKRTTLKEKKKGTLKSKSIANALTKKGYRVAVGDAVKAVKGTDWVWLRSSRTESETIRLIVDADHPEHAIHLLDEAKELLG